MKMRRIVQKLLTVTAMIFTIHATAYADAVPEDFQLCVPSYGGSYTEGILNWLPAGETFTPVYEFYSPYMKDYLLTASDREMEQLVDDYAAGKQTYQYNGIAGYVYQTQAPETIPVYRFWNEKTTDHFYTTSEQEKEYVMQAKETKEDDYVYEGIAWYVPEMSNYAVYRFYDVENLNHYYSDSIELRDILNDEYLRGQGNYRYEGIAWYWYR